MATIERKLYNGVTTEDLGKGETWSTNTTAKFYNGVGSSTDENLHTKVSILTSRTFEYDSLIIHNGYCAPYKGDGTSYWLMGDGTKIYVDDNYTLKFLYNDASYDGYALAFTSDVTITAYGIAGYVDDNNRLVQARFYGKGDNGIVYLSNTFNTNSLNSLTAPIDKDYVNGQPHTLTELEEDYGAEAEWKAHIRKWGLGNGKASSFKVSDFGDLSNVTDAMRGIGYGGLWYATFDSDNEEMANAGIISRRVSPEGIFSLISEAKSKWDIGSTLTRYNENGAYHFTTGENLDPDNFIWRDRSEEFPDVPTGQYRQKFVIEDDDGNTLFKIVLYSNSNEESGSYYHSGKLGVYCYATNTDETVFYDIPFNNTHYPSQSETYESDCSKLYTRPRSPIPTVSDFGYMPNIYLHNHGDEWALVCLAHDTRRNTYAFYKFCAIHNTWLLDKLNSSKTSSLFNEESESEGNFSAGGNGYGDDDDNGKPTKESEEIGGRGQGNGGNSESGSDSRGVDQSPSDPNPPSINGLNCGFVRAYDVTLAQCQTLAQEFTTGDAWTELKKFFQGNPMNGIVSLHMIPCKIPSSYLGTPETVKFGRFESTSTLTPIDNGNFVTIDCGEIDVSTNILGEMFTGYEYLNYSPYTSVDIYLPFIGMQTLDTADVMGRKLRLIYWIDILTGSVTAGLKVYYNDGWFWRYFWHGSSAYKIPMASVDHNQMISALINTASSTVSIGATLGMSSVFNQPFTSSVTQTVTTNHSRGKRKYAEDIVTQQKQTVVENDGNDPTRGIINQTAQQTNNLIQNMKPNVQHCDGLSSISGWFSPRKPYVMIKSPCLTVPKQFARDWGRPCNKFLYVKECSGFTAYSSVNINGIQATEIEKEEIEQYLKGGFYA